MKIIFIILISLLISDNNSIKQWDLAKLYSNQVKNNSINLQNHHNATILDSNINKDSYIVGPGDEFFINFSVNDITFSNYIVISQLNDIIIPNLGMINLYGLSLNQAYNKIQKMFNDKYSNLDIDITLTDVRKFYVNIYGTNSGPSKILTNPLEKLSDVYEKIISQININEDKNLTYRNIVLKRGLNISYIDLLEYRKLGTGYNPRLTEGDEIYFSNFKKYIDIYGGVNNPGRYEFKENELLIDFINICGGFTENYDVENINISRFHDDQKFPQEIKINDNFDSFLIEEYDYILIPKFDNTKNFVQIDGEVNIPGYYLLEKNMTVQDLINKAGGYTKRANIDILLINNEILKEIYDFEFQRINLIHPQNRSLSEISYLQSRSLIPKGSMSSNNKIMTSKLLNYDLNVNDQVHVPLLINFIEILGAVKNPGRYPYIEGCNISDYLYEAGGKTNNYRGKTYIMNSFNQKIKVSKRYNNINNGDIIFIETNEDFNTWNKLKDSMIIIGQLATLIAVIQSASN
jgi:protein involved in polysaccharide export with SLBB domain